jgi:Plant mobile domain
LNPYTSLKNMPWCIHSFFFFTSHHSISSSGALISLYDPIPRRPLSEYHILYEDPVDWTPLTSVIRGTPVYLRSGGLIFHDEQPHDITPLHPRGSASVAPLTHLLGQEMIDGEASGWDDVSLASPLRYHDFQVEWTRYILMQERDILDSTGTYDAIFLSMFSYHLDTSWLWAFCERWNYSTNTLFVEDRELTPTLWELYQLTGLPIFGRFYDEYMISDDDLRDSTQLSSSLRSIYEIYHQLRGSHPSVPFSYWISYFVDRLHPPSVGLASPRDPFGTGRLTVRPDGDIPAQDSICSHAIDRETYLTAFLSWWICYFILPSSTASIIRPSVFVMASMIARGERVSLAVPVLANIYRSLRGLTSSRRPSHCRELIPWHLISGWLHMHWSGLYRPTLDLSLRRGLPLLSDIVGVQPAAMTAMDARFHFYRSREHLRFAHSRLATHHTVRSTDRAVTDGRVLLQGVPSIRHRPDDLDYLISIRQGFLPLRIGSYAFIEPYSPHRCSHQFGLDQDVPEPLIRPGTMAANLEGVGWCYTHLFRMRTGSRCQMVSATRVPTFSRAYVRWYYDVIHPYQSFTPSTVIASTCPHGPPLFGHPVIGGRIPFPAITVAPVDFQGLDSRFSRLPAMTTLTGMLIDLFMSHSLLLYGRFDHFGLFYF